MIGFYRMRLEDPRQIRMNSQIRFCQTLIDSGRFTQILGEMTSRFMYNNIDMFADAIICIPAQNGQRDRPLFTSLP